MATSTAVSLHFNYHPLSLAVSLVCDDAVADHQVYHSAADEYAPDYSLTPLVITPKVSVADPDGVFSTGNAAPYLSNIVWKAIENGVETTVPTASPDYEYDESGSNAGRLKVKRNIASASPLTLVFTADLVDLRGSGETHHLQAQHTVRSTTVAEVPLLTIDAGNPTYDPTRDVDNKKLTARLWVNGSEAAASCWLAQWEFYRDATGQWSVAGSDDFDYFATVSGKTITINRRRMREGVSLRCRAVFDAGGSPSLANLTPDSPVCYASLTRRIPALYPTIERCPGRLMGGQTVISPKVRVRTHGQKGEVSLTTGDLFVRWKMASSTASGLGTKKTVAEGENPTIQLSNLGSAKNGVLECEVIDNGPLKPWADENGAIITDESGNWLLI